MCAAYITDKYEVGNYIVSTLDDANLQRYVKVIL